MYWILRTGPRAFCSLVGDGRIFTICEWWLGLDVVELYVGCPSLRLFADTLLVRCVSTGKLRLTGPRPMRNLTDLDLGAVIYPPRILNNLQTLALMRYSESRLEHHTATLRLPSFSVIAMVLRRSQLRNYQEGRCHFFPFLWVCGIDLFRHVNSISLSGISWCLTQKGSSNCCKPQGEPLCDPYTLISPVPTLLLSMVPAATTHALCINSCLVSTHSQAIASSLIRLFHRIGMPCRSTIVGCTSRGCQRDITGSLSTSSP